MTFTAVVTATEATFDQDAYKTGVASLLTGVTAADISLAITVNTRRARALQAGTLSVESTILTTSPAIAADVSAVIAAPTIANSIATATNLVVASVAAPVVAYTTVTPPSPPTPPPPSPPAPVVAPALTTLTGNMSSNLVVGADTQAQSVEASGGSAGMTALIIVVIVVVIVLGGGIAFVIKKRKDAKAADGGVSAKPTEVFVDIATASATTETTTKEAEIEMEEEETKL